MFHAVNGDSDGAKLATPAFKTLPDTSLGNKGDRGYSDQAEARVFMIGTPHAERSVR